MAYLLDTDVFVQAKNLHYGFDFCPAFWEWLIQANAAKRLYSNEKIADEIEAGRDELSDWAAQRGPDFFLKLEPTILPSLTTVSTWVQQQRYEQAAVNIFLQAADYFLIAHAHSAEHIVVTHEVSAPSTKRIKIPNVCIGVGIKFMTPFEMLRRERARFVLGH